MLEGEAANRQILVDLAFTQGMAALVMVGRQDRWSPVSQHEEIALMPHAELVALEDSGHMLFPKRRCSTANARCAATASTRWPWAGAIPSTGRPSRRTRRRILDRFELTAEEKTAVMSRNWREMVRLGGNVSFILKITAIDPVRLTEIGAHQARMDHDTFLRDRLGRSDTAKLLGGLGTSHVPSIGSGRTGPTSRW